ncbi:MAG: ABC transporter permease [Lachnospiraceae bacterium]|nr:ABC transporter permease [Lachnospiraceae bacterium]
MRKFIGLTRRNLLIYFKDKVAILFSILTSLIVLVLYLLFLKGTYQDAFDSALEEVPMLTGLIRNEDIESFINVTLLIGMMGSALITVPYSCLTTIVKDRENKIDYDISATPIKRWQIILSYFTSASVSACIVTGLLLTAGLVILNADGGLLLEAEDIFKAYGMVMLGAVSATGIFMTLMLFFRTSQASSSFFGMLSAAAGFVIGAYIPISQFSDSVQTVCNLFPATHVTVAIRNILMRGVMESIDSSIGGVDGGAFTEVIRDSFTFSARMFGENIGLRGSLIYIVIMTVLSMLIMTFAYSGTYRRK